MSICYGTVLHFEFRVLPEREGIEHFNRNLNIINYRRCTCQGSLTLIHMYMVTFVGNIAHAHSGTILIIHISVCSEDTKLTYATSPDAPLRNFLAS